jgi:arabinofuranosyltransferase
LLIRKIARSLPNLLPWLIFALAIAARLIPGARTIDDAYITFRYARNLLAGLGFVYNAGERVMGTTTPIYTLLMAFLGGLSGGASAPFPRVALYLNAIADALTCLVLLRLGKKLGFRFAGIAAALTWAVAPYSVTFAIGGLETSIYVLLLTGTMLAYMDQRRIVAALLASLAFLTRPDALILVAPLALDRVWQWFEALRRDQLNLRQVMTEFLALTLPVVAWMIFASIYFGSPIPQSIVAKSLAYRISPEADLVRLIQHYATPYMDNLTFGTGWIGVGFILYLFLYLIGVWKAVKFNVHAWPLAAYPWIYFVIFAAANPLIFRWYLTPPLPAYYLFILGGAETLLISLAGMISVLKKPPAAKSDQHIQTYRWVSVIVILFPLTLSLHAWQLHPDHGPDRPAPEMAWYKLELLYQQAASILDSNFISREAPETSLAAGDVGVLGYTTGMRIIDTVGLNSPQSSSYYPLDPSNYVINYAIPTKLILDTQPDFIVVLEVYGRKSFLSDPAFWQDYSLLQKIPTDIYGSDGMLIFERRTS